MFLFIRLEATFLFLATLGDLITGTFPFQKHTAEGLCSLHIMYAGGRPRVIYLV